ncbi:MAG: hypothetical protein AAF658_10325 [Myxococcota bacterium]
MPIEISEVPRLTAAERTFLTAADQATDAPDGHTSTQEINQYVSTHAGLRLTGSQIDNLKSRVAGLEPPKHGGVRQNFVLNERYWTWPFQTVLDLQSDGDTIGTVSETNPIRFWGGVKMEWRDGDGALVATAQKQSVDRAFRRLVREGRVGEMIQIDDGEGKPIGRLAERVFDTVRSGHTSTRFEVWVADENLRDGYRLEAYSRKVQVRDSSDTQMVVTAADSGKVHGTLARSEGWIWEERFWSDIWTGSRIQGPDELHPAFLVFSAALKTEAGDDSTTTETIDEPRGD